MSNAVTYNKHEGLWGRFISHAELGLSKNIQPHKASILEKMGNAILWTAEDLPGIVWDQIKKPKAVTVALTSLALLGNSVLFYPSKTWQHMKAFFKWLPLPPAWAVRFASYIYTCSLIVGYGLRAYGRFSNQQLMNDFYQKNRANL